MCFSAHLDIRITPAYAGKSQGFGVSLLLMRDHPRLRGEKRLFRRLWGIHLGSPPLTRGKEKQKNTSFPLDRITPAYAGKSPRFGCRTASARDHPRLRGEKQAGDADQHRKEGSPPLTRGKVCRRYQNAARRGITPAYAGKRSGRQLHMSQTEDHPRLRGEKILWMSRCLPKKGSPPLTRGKVLPVWIKFRFRRITPAYAGKSLYGSCYADNIGDHPRLRGEKRSIIHHTKSISGSPPLTRGKVGVRVRRIAEERITPAYAGKSRVKTLRP